MSHEINTIYRINLRAKLGCLTFFSIFLTTIPTQILADTVNRPPVGTPVGVGSSGSMISTGGGIYLPSDGGLGISYSPGYYQIPLTPAQDQIIKAMNLSPAERCIQSICGPAQNLNSPQEKFNRRLDAYIGAETNNPTEADYPPKVKAQFQEHQAVIEQQNKLFKSSLSSLESAGDKRLEGEAKAIYNLMEIAPQLSKVAYKRADKSNKSSAIVIDEVASRNALKDLSRADQDYALRVSFYLNDHAELKLGDAILSKEMPDIFMKSLYPTLTLKEALELEYKKAEENLKKIKDTSSPIANSIYFTSTTLDRLKDLKKAIADGSINENQIRELVRWNSSFATNFRIFAPTNNPLLERETPKISELLKNMGGTKSLEKIMTADADERRLKDEREFSQCKMDHFLNRGLLPDQNQIPLINADIDRAKGHLKQAITNNFPKEVHQTLFDVIDRDKFILPLSKQEFEHQFSEDLQRKTDSEKQTLDRIKPADPTSLTSIYLALHSKDAPITSDTDKHAVDQTPPPAMTLENSTCDAYKYLMFPDGNYTSLGKIQLGYGTALANDMGRQRTITHELTHSVFRNINATNPKVKTWFADIKKCLSNQHHEAPPNLRSNFNDEDFADMLAMVAYQGIGGQNPWCHRLEVNSSMSTYNDKTLVQKNKGPNGLLDEHSSGLFRLLHFQHLQKGQFPEVCSEFMEASKYQDPKLKTSTGRPTQSDSALFKDAFQPCLEVANQKLRGDTNGKKPPTSRQRAVE
jgi:hypothetical protein